MQITELRKQKGKKDMFSLFADGKFVCSLNEFCIYKNRLTVGAEINNDTLNKIQCESMGDVAFTLSLDLLSTTLKTTKQMEEYLQKKGFLPLVIEQVLQKLCDYGYLNDRFFAECFVQQKSHSVGKFKIKNELKLKGIDNQILDEVLQNVTDQDDVILGLAQKFLKKRELTPDTFNKLCRHLCSKGFGWDEINRVVSKIKRDGGVYDDWE